jgi:hypothetical protein
LKRLALLVLALGLVALASGQTSGHTSSPIATPPETAFHPVTDDLAPTPLPSAVVDDLGQPSPIPRPSIAVPRPSPIVTASVSPKPRSRPKPAARPVTYPSVADAKAYARRVLGSTQFACLNEIALHESNWNPHDRNPTSGAYGIPQALPGTKMAVIAADWRDNPVTQVKWMIRYVDAAYGSACRAWSFWQTHHWY